MHYHSPLEQSNEAEMSQTYSWKKLTLLKYLTFTCVGISKLHNLLNQFSFICNQLSLTSNQNDMAQKTVKSTLK